MGGKALYSRYVDAFTVWQEEGKVSEAEDVSRVQMCEDSRSSCYIVVTILLSPIIYRRQLALYYVDMH